MIAGAAIISSAPWIESGIVFELIVNPRVRTYVRFECDPGHTEPLVGEGR